MSVEIRSWSRNWGGDEAREISSSQIMKEGGTMKERQWGTIEEFEAWGPVGDTSITFINIDRFHE